LPYHEVLFIQCRVSFSLSRQDKYTVVQVLRRAGRGLKLHFHRISFSAKKDKQTEGRFIGPFAYLFITLLAKYDDRAETEQDSQVVRK
jgi:hypothetical protein